MCRNIKTLFNFDPPVTNEEVRNASLQFVRKLTGLNKPSTSNEVAFNLAVDKITSDVQDLLDSLTTRAKPRARGIEAERAHDRAMKRFGN